MKTLSSQNKSRKFIRVVWCLLSGLIKIVAGGWVGHLKDLLNFSRFTWVTLTKKVNLLKPSLWYRNWQNNVVKLSSVFGDLFSVKTGDAIYWIWFEFSFKSNLLYLKMSWKTDKATIYRLKYWATPGKSN